VLARQLMTMITVDSEFVLLLVLVNSKPVTVRTCWADYIDFLVHRGT